MAEDESGEAKEIKDPLVVITKDSDATMEETTTTMATTTTAENGEDQSTVPAGLTDRDGDRKNWRMKSHLPVFSSSSSSSTPVHSRSATPGDPFSEPEDQPET